MKINVELQTIRQPFGTLRAYATVFLYCGEGDADGVLIQHVGVHQSGERLEVRLPATEVRGRRAPALILKGETKHAVAEAVEEAYRENQEMH